MFSPKKSYIVSACLLPQDILVVGFYDGSLKVLNFKTRKVTSLAHEHTEQIDHISPLAHQSFVTASANTIKVWILTKCVNTLRTGLDIKFMGTVPSGKIIFRFYGINSNQINIWDPHTSHSKVLMYIGRNDTILLLGQRLIISRTTGKKVFYDTNT